MSTTPDPRSPYQIFLGVCGLLYRVTMLTLLALTFYTTLTLAATWHRDNQLMGLLRKGNLELQVENKMLYDELVKAGDLNRELDDEVYKARLELRVLKERRTL